MKFKNMFSPIQIGPMVVPNRFVVPPMGNNLANTDGTMSERSRDYYAARAKGGFGLITFEATVVDPTAKGGPRKPCLFSDDVIDSFKMVIDACHEQGSKVSIQLQHAGAEGNAKGAGYPLKAASAIPATIGRDTPEEMTTKEIYDLVELYGDAAYRAKLAGADAVEVHCAHGYLINSFLSVRTNKRCDEFGGCFENRMRIVRLIVENIRRKAGSKMAIICRINCRDDILGGNNQMDSATIAAYMEEIGVDGLHVSRAVHIRDEFMWAPTCTHAGFNADYVTEIKRAVSIPVIMVGRFTDPYYADLLVKEGRTDLVAFGRQSLADPNMPNKSKAGCMEEISPCIACLQGCVPNMYQGKPIECLVNPQLGHENEFKKAETKKKVIVVGGGVGGMMAARITAQRGHDVTLYEASEKLGGNMRLAAFPPGKGDITNMIRSYIVQCEKAGVKIVLNTEVTEALLKEEAADAVILSTGANPLILPIPGINDTGVIQASDLLDGKRACGKKVLVVGGGMVGCEVADFLGEQNHEVTVIEMNKVVAGDMIAEHKKYVMEHFEEYKIQTVTGAVVSKFHDDGVSFKDVDHFKEENAEVFECRGFDSVVLAMGFRNNNPLEETAKKISKEVYVLGDAVRARRALDATKEAFEIGLTI